MVIPSFVLLLLKILGWKVADTQAKALAFDCHFVSLGVQLSLDAIPKSRTLVLTNKPGRVEAIRKRAEGWLQPGARMGSRDALSIRNKISFAESYTFARLSAPAARIFVFAVVVFHRLCLLTPKSLS